VSLRAAIPTPRRARVRAAPSPLALALALGLGAGPAQAQAADEAPLAVRYELNATEVAVGDSFQLDIVVTVKSQAQVEELSLPELPRAFTVLQERRASSTQMSAVQGRREVSVEQRYMYLLRAEEAGSFRIPEATARVGRAVARAAPVVVRVVDSDAAQGRAEEGAGPGARFGKSPPTAFLEVTLDRTTAWPGQQITATTEIYTQQPLAQWPRLPALKPPGFFCTTLLGEERPSPSQRTIAGRSYYVYLVNKDALFALGPGEKELPALSADVVPAGSLFSRQRSLSVRSAPATITIKPLPSEGRPSGFVPGNVGHWQLQASVRPARGTLGEPLTLTLVATGTGSLEQLVLPTWAGADQARVFPATTRREPRKTTLTDAELGGRVVVELLVQPQAEGPFKIPAFTLVTFNPEAGRYVESTTAPLVVPIGAAKGASPGLPAGTSARQLIARGARPLKRNVVAQTPPTNAPVFVGLAALAGGLALWTGGTLRRRRQGSATRRRE
jgi:hypothetical protein